MGNNIFINEGTIEGGVCQKNNSGDTSDTSPKLKGKKKNQYDVAISYASEQETYVNRVVKILEVENLKVFFAPKREEEYKADDMYSSFYQIYRYQSRWVVCFVSSEYLGKEYTMSEYASAKYKSLDCGENRIIEVCFNNARLPGYDIDINYLNGDKLLPIDTANKIKEIVRHE